MNKTGINMILSKCVSQAYLISVICSCSRRMVAAAALRSYQVRRGIAHAGFRTVANWINLLMPLEPSCQANHGHYTQDLLLKASLQEKIPLWQGWLWSQPWRMLHRSFCVSREMLPQEGDNKEAISRLVRGKCYLHATINATPAAPAVVPHSA